MEESANAQSHELACPFYVHQKVQTIYIQEENEKRELFPVRSISEQDCALRGIVAAPWAQKSPPWMGLGLYQWQEAQQNPQCTVDFLPSADGII